MPLQVRQPVSLLSLPLSLSLLPACLRLAPLPLAASSLLLLPMVPELVRPSVASPSSLSFSPAPLSSPLAFTPRLQVSLSHQVEGLPSQAPSPLRLATPSSHPNLSEWLLAFLRCPSPAACSPTRLVLSSIFQVRRPIVRPPQPDVQALPRRSPIVFSAWSRLRAELPLPRLAQLEPL